MNLPAWVIVLVELAFLVLAAAVFSGCFILAQFIVYGHVKW